MSPERRFAAYAARSRAMTRERLRLCPWYRRWLGYSLFDLWEMSKSRRKSAKL
jgi:hypothetical protein